MCTFIVVCKTVASLADKLASRASWEALSFLRDTLPPTVFRPKGGADAVAMRLRELLAGGQLATLAGGMDSLPRALLRNSTRANQR